MMTFRAIDPAPMNAASLAAIATAEAAGVVAWYALPDVVRSRTVRGVAKTALLSGIVALELWRYRETLLFAREVWSGSLDEAPACEVSEEPSLPANEDETRTGQDVAAAPTPHVLIGVGTLLAATAVAGGVCVERWLFRRGERRRALGIRAAHTRQGLWLGGLVGGLVVADEVLFNGTGSGE